MVLYGFESSVVKGWGPKTKKIKREKLKPCPLCNGGADFSRFNNNAFKVQCQNSACGLLLLAQLFPAVASKADQRLLKGKKFKTVEAYYTRLCLINLTERWNRRLA